MKNSIAKNKTTKSHKSEPGWFCEDKVPGKRFGKVKHCFLMEQVLFKGKTKFQDILIFKNSVYGRVLILDGIVQFSEKDEFFYHETIAHPVLFSHPNPQKVLIIGGGDGGALREVLKHPVKEVYLVDIDRKASEIFRKFLPFVSGRAFYDKRVKLFFEDGAEFIKRFKDFFDVVIIDGNDPVNTSVSLFTKEFYKNIALSLNKQGIIITLAGSSIDFEGWIKANIKRIRAVFPKIQIFRTTIASYHCGDFFFVAASQRTDFQKIDLKKIEKRFLKIKKKNKFKYYSPQIHLAISTLPEIWKID